MLDLSPLTMRGPAAIEPVRWLGRRAASSAAAPDAEFPPDLQNWPDGPSRREFVRLLGATALAVAGTACAGPAGDIVPYVSSPPELTPGMPLHFATAMELDGYATGLVAESREGRPVKIEGNPRHPASLGAAGSFHQASILQLYDPDRGRAITHDSRPSGGDELADAFSLDELRRLAGRRGHGLHLLLEPTASASTLALLDSLRDRFPGLSVCFHAPLATMHAASGARVLFGRALQSIVDLSRADVVVALDADILTEGPFALRYSRQFADRRRVRHPGDAMNRLYVVESAVTSTGTAADHRIGVRPSEIGPVLLSLYDAVAGAIGSAGVPRTASVPLPASFPWLPVIARDLVAHRSQAVVLLGERQPPALHAVAHGINELLAAQGRTVSYVEPACPEERPGENDLSTLLERLRARDVSALVAIGGDPAFTTPPADDLADLVRAVPLSLFAGMYGGVTARCTRWYVPLAHYLETWADARALDGTSSIAQPIVRPLFGGRSRDEVLASLAGDPRGALDIVKTFWQHPDRLGPDPDRWMDALRQGLVENSAAPAAAANPSWPALQGAISSWRPAAPAAIELVLRPSAAVYDGRFANLGWLQELPDPITKTTWGNPLMMNAGTARAIGCSAGDLLDVNVANRSVRAPAVVVDGMADGTIALAFGYGNQETGRVSRDVGASAYAIWADRRAFDQPATVTRATWIGIPLSEPLPLTQLTTEEGGRRPVVSSALDQLPRTIADLAHDKAPRPALYGTTPRAGRQWAMAIDLTVCTGCSACVVACQAENNVPVVGKTGVLQGRAMHWLRIDRYADGTGPGASYAMQPMLCQHCEDAPCEYVCPVNATVHSPDGLNEMVYNRCVGTRFCSNNCPYKVRRFNWLNYTAGEPEPLPMARNPDVTVRDRGVMEKCTFCVQRIRRADIDASASGSDVAYATLQTACQQACPTRAIVFGSLTDPEAAVTRDTVSGHSYRVLVELGTRPRVHYLARIRNPNPAWPRESPR